MECKYQTKCPNMNMNFCIYKEQEGCNYQDKKILKEVMINDGDYTLSPVCKFLSGYELDEKFQVLPGEVEKIIGEDDEI